MTSARAGTRLASENFSHEQVVQVNEIELYFKEFGQGMPLLMLHGFFGVSEFWEPYVDTFAQDYRLIVPDLRGHGRSTNPSGAYTEQQSALDMFALLDWLGIEQFCGIGISYGATILLTMATQQPARVKGMVVIDGTYRHTQESGAVQSGLTMETIDPSFLTLLRTWHTRGEEQVRSLIQQFSGFSQQDLNLAPATLATITARTLIVHGDRDEFFPVSIALEMYRVIPRAYLWVVPNARHVLFFEVFGGKAPGGDIFASTALAFLRGDWE